MNASPQVRVQVRRVRDNNNKESGMRRKPDWLWIIVIVFGLGVVTTGYTQGFVEHTSRHEVIRMTP